MKQIKAIKVPATLFLFQDNETIDEAAKQFALCIYTYLIERKGMDDKVYCRLCDLLETCGYKNGPNAYSRGYFDALKEAICFLQDNNYIGAITVLSSGEAAHITTIKPKDIICLEVSADNIPFDCSFAIIPYEAYHRLQAVKNQNGSLYWKCLMVFCYICHKLMYNPYTEKAKNNSWAFSQEKIIDTLRSKFSITTMQKVFDILHEYDIIASSKVYVKAKKEDPAPYCIGTVICLVGEKDYQTIQRELKVLKVDAQNRYITNYKNVAL